MLKQIKIALIPLGLMTPGLWLATAADWPMWRHDAQRSAVTEAALSAELHLQWTYDLGQPDPAWPETQRKLQFDASYEPVVKGDTIYVPSMVTDSVRAFDIVSGTERWRFHAEAPVRLAPVAYDDKVAFVSDDGYLYCLNARDGSLQWKLRGGPGDRRVLGNDRLVSLWPARGGPVLLDDTIYFAASVWPFMGTFIYAVDAQTGDVRWCNSGSGSDYITQQHDSPAFAGVAPQGYLSAAGDLLLVAGGRSVPAAYDRHTGAFRYYHLSSREFGKDAGGYGATIAGDHFINGRALYRFEDGDGLLRVNRGIATPTRHYSVYGDSFTVRELPPEHYETKSRRGKIEKRVRLNRVWEQDLADGPDRLFLKAGNRLYGSRKGKEIIGIDLEEAGEKPTATLAWRRSIDGQPWTMIAAQERLFVVTREGRLHCYGASKRTPAHLPAKGPPALVQHPVYDAHVRNTLQSFPASTGYALSLGIGSGGLIDALVAHSDLQIIAVDPDPERVRSLQDRLVDAGHYGHRVVAMVGDPFSLSLPPYFVKLMVSEDLAQAGFKPGEGDARQLFDTLRPYGGAAVMLPTDPRAKALADWAMASGVEGLVRTKDVIQRPGALPGSGSWTHQQGDAANSVVSKDRRVKTPLGLLWFGGPPNDEVLPRHGHGPSPQVVGGRLFIEGPDMLRAVDVYTGRLLWQRELPGIGTYYDNTKHQPGANEIGGNFVTTADSVYVMSPRACLRLDPSTGKTLAEFTLPPPPGQAEAPKWGFIAVWSNKLVATVSPIGVSDSKAKPKPEQRFREQLADRAAWRYLAGAHPVGDWTRLDYDDQAWSRGRAGFGYGDDDDDTILKEMKGRYQVVYLRQAFNLELVPANDAVQLGIRFDDAFIAYLNGKEIVRKGVGRGRGASARNIEAHEADEFEFFSIKAADLRAGRNILAIEGHNQSINSSDFSLNPLLGVVGGNNAQPLAIPKQGIAGIGPGETAGIEVNTDYASGSGTLVVMDRFTGKVAWSRPARHTFRHNAIAVADNKVFCIDKMSEQKIGRLKRRGWAISDDATVYALDLATGAEVWSSRDQVFGTWLGYSEKHDILVEGGSHSRDRAKDEAEKGFAAYQGRDGKRLWSNDDKYDGPFMLHHQTIFTQGGAYDLLSGERRLRQHPVTGRKLPWGFSRNYGCNTAIGSEHLLTFRSAAAGYFDLENDSGTGNLGGFRSGCTANLIVADGVLNAPDYTHTCTCSYQNQSSLAFVHMEDAEIWTFNNYKSSKEPVQQLGINFGAPGDRRADNGTLWLEYPVVGGPSPTVPLRVAFNENPGRGKPQRFRHHSSRIQHGPMSWVASSGLVDVRRLEIKLGDNDAAQAIRNYTVRLYFADTEERESGVRKFDVRLQGKPVLQAFDVARESGGFNRCVMKEFTQVPATGILDVSLTPSEPDSLPPIISGLEVVAE